MKNQNHSINSEMEIEEKNSNRIPEEVELENKDESYSENEKECNSDSHDIESEQIKLKKESEENNIDESFRDGNFSKSYTNGNNQSIYNSKITNQHLHSKKKSKISSIVGFFINVKKIFFIILLIIGNLFNFSVLNNFYFFIAILFAYKYKDSEKQDISKKRYLVYVNLFFCVSILIFKIIFFFIFSNKELIEKDKNIMISLGLLFLKEYNFRNILFTFIFDVLIFIYSLIYLLSCWNYNESLDAKDIKKIQIKLTDSKITFLYLILHMIYYCLLIIYISFTTIFYSIFIHIGLFFKVFQKSDRYNSYVFLMFICSSFLHLLATNITNIPYMQILIDNNETKKILNMIGIIILPPKHNEMDKDKEFYLNCQFFGDYFLNILALIFYIVISSIKNLSLEDKKKSLMKRKENNFSNSILDSSSSASHKIMPKKAATFNFEKQILIGDLINPKKNNLFTIEEEEKNKYGITEGETHSREISHSKSEKFDSYSEKILPQSKIDKDLEFFGDKNNSYQEKKILNYPTNPMLRKITFSIKKQEDKFEHENLEKKSLHGKKPEKNNDEDNKLNNIVEAKINEIETEDFDNLENKDVYLDDNLDNSEYESEGDNVSENDYSSDYEEEEQKESKFNKILYFIERFCHGIYKFYKKIKSFLYAYLISAYFRLDICRFCTIYWIYEFENYQSILLILWLFFTIQAESLKYINIFTFILAWPGLLLNYYSFMVSNITDLLPFYQTEDDNIYFWTYGLQKFENPAIQFTFIHLTIIAFTFLSINLNDNTSPPSDNANNNTIFNSTSFYNKNHNHSNIDIKVKEFKEEKNKNIIEMEDKVNFNEKLNNTKELIKTFNNFDKTDLKEGLLGNKEEIVIKNKNSFEKGNQSMNPKKKFLDGLNSQINEDCDDIGGKKEKNGYNNLAELPSINIKNKGEGDESPNDDKDNIIKFSDIIIKFFIKHIDKITLIFIYLIAIEKVNIIHFLLTMIFMLQLILPQVIRKICSLIILILQLVILFEYSWYFVKVNLVKLDENFISLFFDYDMTKLTTKTLEINIVFVMYCYYIQKVNYSTSFYNDKKLDFEVYIIKKFEQVKILNFVQELYVWILFIFTFIAITWYYECLFAFKLLFFSILFYKFLNLKDLKSIKKYIWLFILYCGLNTLMIYLYQFKKLNYLKDYFEELNRLFPDYISKNLKVIGLEEYNTSNLPAKLLPHYVSNFLSVLLLWEISRICELSEAQKITKKSNDLFSDERISFNNDNILTVKNSNKKDVDNNSEINQTLQNKLKKRSFGKGEDKKQTKPKSIAYYKFILFCLKLGFFLCRIYWLIIYVSVCFIFSAVSFSFSIIVYIILITKCFMLFFKRILAITKQSMSLFKINLNYLKSLRYPIEKKKMTKAICVSRKLCFKLILFFALLFISLTYIFTLLDFVQSDKDSSQILRYDVYEIIKAISYVIGIFNKYDENKSFMNSVWAHLFLLLLICLDSYIQKLELFINEQIEILKIFITKLIAKNIKSNKIDKLIKSFNMEDKPAGRFSNNRSFSISRKNSRASDNFLTNYRNNRESYKSLLEESMVKLMENPIIGEDVKKSEFLKKFIKIFLKFDIRNQMNKTENNNEFIELNKTRHLIPKNLYISFFSFMKKFFEEFVIFLLILDGLFKLNILSLFYVIIIIIMIFSRHNHVKMYRLSIIISFLIVIQTLIFLSNLSERNDPNSSSASDIYPLIKERLNIPWYDLYNKKKIPMEFFFSFGVNDYQVLILWIEFMIIIVLFVYFDNFCYFVYHENENPYAFINFYYYNKQDYLKNSINSYTEKKFENLRIDLKQNFFIELPEFTFFLNKINRDYDRYAIQTVQTEIQEENKENNVRILSPIKDLIMKKVVSSFPEKTREKNVIYKQENSISNNPPLRKVNSKFFDNVNLGNNIINDLKSSRNQKKGKCYKICEKMRKFMYLNMHNFTLILTLFLSLLNTGGISTIYIGFIIYNLNKSYSIKRKKNFTFPRFIKYKFRLVLICDIFIQLIYQIPISPFLSGNMSKILEKIGIYKIKTDIYDKNTKQLYEDKLALVLIKALTYLLLSLQVIIYSSNDFKDFYLKYIFKNTNIFLKKAIINSFLYNNRLIQKMKKSIKSRESIDEFLVKLENQISEWSTTNIIKKNTQIKMQNISVLQDENYQEKSNPNINNSYLDKSTLSAKEENSAMSEKIVKFNDVKMPGNNTNKSIAMDKIKFNREEVSNMRDRLEIQFDEFFENQTKTKNYFKNKIQDLFMIHFINVFNRNTTNFIFIRREDEFKFEKSIFRGDSYIKSLLEEKLDEEIEKISFMDISTEDIDIILSNIDKAQKIINKKIHGKDKLKKKKKLKIKKRKSNLIDNYTNSEINFNKKEFNNNVIKEISESDEVSDNENEDDDHYDILKDETRIDDVPLYKYYRILNNKIFEKYYSSKEKWFYIVYHFFEFLLDNFQFICFFFMILNNFFNGNMISLVWPILVFTIGIISNPRPTNIFWKISMIYCSAVIMIKFIMQIRVDNNFFLSEYFSFDKYRIGLKSFNDLKAAQFINYIIWDCLLLLCLLIQQYILITNGLWKNIENQIETVKEAHERIFKCQIFKTDVQLEEFADELFEMHLNKMKAEEARKKQRNKDDSKNVEKNIIRKNPNKGKEGKDSKDQTKEKDKEKEKEKEKLKKRNTTLYNSSGINEPKLGEIAPLKERLHTIEDVDKVKSYDLTKDKKRNTLFTDISKNQLNFNTNSVNIISKPENSFGKELTQIPMIKKFHKMGSVIVRNEKKLYSPQTYNRKASFINKSNFLNEKFQQINKSNDLPEKSEKINNDDQKQGFFINFFSDIFPIIRNKKPGKDFYAFYCGFSIFLIFYIIIFYYRLDRDVVLVNGTDNNYNQFSGGQVFILFLHAIISVTDRIIYARQSRDKMEKEFFYYSKKDLKEIPERNARLMNDNEYYSFFYQKESTNFPLISKYLLHIFITIFSHIFIFFYLPIIGNLNLINEIICIENNPRCNDMNQNVYLIIFYILYIFYLFFSALQIRFGLHDIKKKSLFMRKDTILYSVLFKCYKYCPFIYELKLVIDWTCTPTALDIFRWFKFESVYDILFMNQCLVKSVEGVPVGRKVGLLDKILYGGSTFLLLIVLLLGPILLFSTLNPSNITNDVYAASVSLLICFQSGESTYNNFTLFKSESIELISPIDDETWKRFNYIKSPFTKSFPKNQVQNIKMMNSSDTVWNIAIPHIQFMRERLRNYKNYNNTIILSLQYGFTRKQPSDALFTHDQLDIDLFDNQKKIDKYELIKDLKESIANCTQKDIIFTDEFIPGLRLSSLSSIDYIEDQQNFNKTRLKFKLVCDPKDRNSTDSDNSIDYLKSYFQLIAEYGETSQGIFFHTFSDKIASSYGNYNVLTFYSTFILIIGNYIRNFFVSGAERIIITDMPEPQSLITLCEGIKISRYRYDFEREEYLYYVLIDLMRSPETLKKLTKSCLSTYKENLQKNKLRAALNPA